MKLNQLINTDENGNYFAIFETEKIDNSLMKMKQYKIGFQFKEINKMVLDSIINHIQETILNDYNQTLNINWIIDHLRVYFINDIPIHTIFNLYRYIPNNKALEYKGNNIDIIQI